MVLTNGLQLVDSVLVGLWSFSLDMLNRNKDAEKTVRRWCGILERDRVHG